MTWTFEHSNFCPCCYFLRFLARCGLATAHFLFLFFSVSFVPMDAVSETNDASAWFVQHLFCWLCNICFNYSFLSENFLWHCVHLQWHVLLCPPGIAVVELIGQAKKLNLHPNTDPEVLIHLILADRVEKLIFLHFFFAFHFWKFYLLLIIRQNWSFRTNWKFITRKGVCRDWFSPCVRLFQEKAQEKKVQMKCYFSGVCVVISSSKPPSCEAM